MSQRFRDTESRLEAQHAQLRTDIKQALALSAASSRAEAEAEAAARVKDSERRLLARVQVGGGHAQVAVLGLWSSRQTDRVRPISMSVVSSVLQKLCMPHSSQLLCTRASECGGASGEQGCCNEWARGDAPER